MSGQKPTKRAKKTSEILKLRHMNTTAQIPNATKTAKYLFRNDTGEKIDTAEVEEEEWIEYMKRSTIGCGGQDEGSQHSVLDRNSKKHEMEISSEDRTTYRVKVGEKNSNMESRAQH